VASLSALIIAKDEQLDLVYCLLSLKESKLCDEIVVLVDEATTDHTERIAREAGCKVARRAFDDYARQRQAALDLCSKEWVLWIDADEALTPELAASMRAELQAPAHDAYLLRFSMRFLGKTLRFGGMGHETHVRLFRRQKARFVGGAVHEGLEIDGTVGGPLDGIMEHRSYKDLTEYLEKLDRYTTLAAKKKHQAGRRFHWYDHLILPWELFKRLVIRGAILDGHQGVTYAALSAFHHWLKYAKLREMEKRRLEA
jgi:glycosyltransferase involved in cell wall biosynthesis